MNSIFFKNDSHEKFYILGLLYSDGYMSYRGNGKQEYVGLKLIDEQVLNDISKILECNKPIKCGVTSANNQLYRIEFSDKTVISDLKNIGLHHNKTLTIKYPNIPKEFQCDFIRGEFDGDGCIHFSLKKGRVNSYVTNFQIIGTFDLLNGIAKDIGVPTRIIPYKKVAKLLVDKKDDLIKLYNFLYKNENCLCLERKKQHFKECIDVIYNSRIRQKEYKKKEQLPRKSSEEFIEKARLVHGDRYDYSKVEYKNQVSKIKIICQKHGEFMQSPYHHLRGCGCKQCGLENVHKNNTSKQREFIEKARLVHGDRYDYSKVEYKNSREKVHIICPKHGEFWCTPSNHLQGRGCKQCGYGRRSAERRKKNKENKE